MLRLAATAAVLISLTLSACNTVKGVGRDVESAGKAVEKTAD